MLKYSDLTTAQKRFVDAILAEDASIAKSGTVSRKQVESLYWTLNEKRAAGGVKVGFPNWLTKPNKVGRGVYSVPMPDATTTAVKQEEVESKSRLEKIIEESDVFEDEYDEELESIKQELAS